jgi:hypothetical protein
MAAALRRIIVARSQTKERAPNPSSAEAVGAYFAICFCRALGNKTLIGEGDAQVVTKAICSNKVNMSIFGHVVADAQNVLHSFFFFLTYVLHSFLEDGNVILFLERLMERSII